jgi:hypothetical protein
MSREFTDEQLEQAVREARPDMPPPSHLAATVVAAAGEAPSRRRRPRVLGLVMVAGLAAVALAWWMIGPVGGPPLVVVGAQRGGVTGRWGRGLAVGTKLSAGAVVRTAKGGRVSLFTRHGSELTLDEDSELALARDGRGATLRRGRLYCRNREHEFARLDTSAGEIRLLGTEVSAAQKRSGEVAVTVVKGQVELVNARGRARVRAGRRAVLARAQAPGEGEEVSPTAALAWYTGRLDVVSDLGQIAYTVQHDPYVIEVWAMNADGSDKRLVKTYLSASGHLGAWLAQSPWVYMGPDYGNSFATSAGTTGWLLNVITGEEFAMALPPEYHGTFDAVLSPDARHIAFAGARQSEAGDSVQVEPGVFVYDVDTGKTEQRYQGLVSGHITWTPDSRYLLASLGETYTLHEETAEPYLRTNTQPLALISVASGEVRGLGVRGTEASFSPDGSRLAYSGDFPPDTGSYYRGTPGGGSVFVLDLTSNAPPQRISPRGEGALSPLWSPDGTRVAYWMAQSTRNGSAFSVYVAAADGSGTSKVYDQQGWLERLSWSPDGEALYVATSNTATSTGVLAIASDGSGPIADLGGTKEDSPLTPEQKAELSAVSGDLRAAWSQYQSAHADFHLGHLEEGRAKLRRVSDLLGGVLYRAPSLSVSARDAARLADAAAADAGRPDAAILANACRTRLNMLRTYLQWEAVREGHFPDEAWFLAQAGRTASDFSGRYYVASFSCPESGRPYLYTPPPAGRDPQIGEVLVTCPTHPEHRLVWTEAMQRYLEFQRRAEARHHAEGAR